MLPDKPSRFPVPTTVVSNSEAERIALAKVWLNGAQEHIRDILKPATEVQMKVRRPSRTVVTPETTPEPMRVADGAATWATSMHSPVLELSFKRLSNGGCYIFTTKVPSRNLRECIECAEPETGGETKRNDSATYEIT